MSRIKVMCINKNRDSKGNIVNYMLKDETGNQFIATAQQIKEEIKIGRYEFVNLQIDKAGRLVDKALPKSVTPKEESFYSVEDLIKHVNPKGRKVKCYDSKTGKEYIGVGSSFWGKGNDGLRNSIYVYIKELGVLAVVRIDGDNGLWAEYNREFPYPFKYSVDIAVADKYYESIGDKIVSFYNYYKKAYNMRMCISSTYKVDANANPNGRYTILEVGKSEERDLYKVRDNKEGTEYWSIRSLSFNVYNNDFTNVAIRRDKPVVAKNVPVVDCTELLKKYHACEDKMKSEFSKRLAEGIHRTSDDQYFVVNQKEFDAVYNKVKRALESLQTDISFSRLVFDAFESVVDYEEHDRMLYYGYMGDDSGWADTDAMFSFDKEVVKQHLQGQFNDWVWSTKESEECSEEEAKELNKHYINLCGMTLSGLEYYKKYRERDEIVEELIKIMDTIIPVKQYTKNKE